MKSTRIFGPCLMLLLFVCAIAFSPPATADPVGACCVGRVCSQENEFTCDDLGGVFSGVGTSCEFDTCYGACCSDIGCSEEDERDCDEFDGVFAGAGTNCDTETCGEGACCTNGPGTQSNCIITTQQDCEANHSLYLGDGAPCTDDLDCTLLLVTMESMSATATPHGVLLSWTTVAEVDTVAFRLLRETPGVREKTLKVIAPMIPAAGNGLTGASYEFLDNTYRSGSAAQYYIEDIDIFGKVTRHGPIVVERSMPNRADGDRREMPTR
jgi:hypothetical protein